MKLIFTRKVVHLAYSEYPEEHEEWTGVNCDNDDDKKNMAMLIFLSQFAPHYWIFKYR